LLSHGNGEASILGKLPYLWEELTPSLPSLEDG
jgi:hypothetical protein